MKVFSTFSGISAASLALKPFGFEIAAYAEPDPECAWVLHHRLGTGRPEYLPKPDDPVLLDRLKKANARLRRAACDHRFKRITNEKLLGLSKRSDLDADIKARLGGLETELRDWKRISGEIENRRRVQKRASEIPDTGASGILNLGDVTQITDDDLKALGHIDVLEGGPPCQAFSVAGNRQGMSDDRGNLSLVFCRLAERMRRTNGTRYVIFENVPATLDLADNSFGCILASLVGERSGPLFPPGRGWPDSGHCVGVGGRSVAWRVLDSRYFGLPQRRRRLFVIADLGGERAAEILFEPASGPRDPVSGPTSWAGSTTGTASGFGESHGDRFSLKNKGHGSDLKFYDECSSTGIKSAAGFHQGNSSRSRTIGFQTEMAPTLKSASSGTNMTPAVLIKTTAGQIVRKLTPRECERAQGFPDDWTLVPTQNDELMADTNRYQMIGNSITVPVLAYIGERIMAADCGRLKEVNRRGRTRFSCGYPDAAKKQTLSDGKFLSRTVKA
ncbi:MAG: DNA cytosine methyltransferase [Pseudomonadota bacterium]